MLGVLEAKSTYHETFKEVFCFSSLLLTADTISCLFLVQYSEKGSNNREVEGLVLSHWNDFLPDVEEDPVEVSFSDTCACELHLPVIHATYDKFKEDVTFALLNTNGFGYA